MKKYGLLMLLLVGTLFAQDEADAKDKKTPTAPAIVSTKPGTVTIPPDKVLAITQFVRDFYRIYSQLSTVQQQADTARAQAVASKTAVEKEFNCDYNLDTNECVLRAPVKEDSKK